MQALPLVCRSCFNLMALSFLMHEIGTRVTCASRAAVTSLLSSVLMVCDVPAGAHSNSVFTGSHLGPEASQLAAAPCCRVGVSDSSPALSHPERTVGSREMPSRRQSGSLIQQGLNCSLK